MLLYRVNSPHSHPSSVLAYLKAFVRSLYKTSVCRSVGRSNLLSYIQYERPNSGDCDDQVTGLASQDLFVFVSPLGKKGTSASVRGGQACPKAGKEGRKEAWACMYEYMRGPNIEELEALLSATAEKMNACCRGSSG